MKILLADDEKDLVKALSAILKQNNYSVDAAFDGESALDSALTGVYDLIVLDVMMTKLDGFSALKILRESGVDTPVLLLTAKSDVSDKISGLNLGADDYITKPFDTEELLARIRALLRRKEKFTGDTLAFGDITLDRDSMLLTSHGKSLAIGKKEREILEMLMLAEGKNIPKERFIEKIWGYDSEAEYNTIEVYVSFLRKKLAAVGAKTEIRVVRGVGYNLGVKND